MIEHRHLDYPENSIPEVGGVEWERARRWLVFTIRQVEDLPPVGTELTFGDFMDSVLFLLEFVGIKKINSPYDLPGHLKSLCVRHFHQSQYPAEIFDGAFRHDTDSGQESLVVNYCFSHLLAAIEGQQLVLRLGRSAKDGLWEPRVRFYQRLEKEVFPKLRLAANAKYLSCISQVAQDLLEELKLRSH